jgi:hypothetical protein|nr:MAG TPA: hypothetical protein [Caudoviricetes sp.]
MTTTSTPDTPSTPPSGDHYYDALGQVTVWDEDRHQWVRGAIVPEGSPSPRPGRPGAGSRPSRAARALALLVVAALGVLALSGIAALVVLIWRAVL